MRTTLVTIQPLFRSGSPLTVETVDVNDLVAEFETRVRLSGIYAESPEVHDACYAMLGDASLIQASTWGGYLSADCARHALGKALRLCGVTEDPVHDAGGVVTWH